jgi:4-carboxymuconolactone decarboxylase
VGIGSLVTTLIAVRIRARKLLFCQRGKYPYGFGYMKSLITPIAALLFAMSAQANPVPDTPAAREAREVAPQLYAYTRDVLFADLWKRPELAARDRSLITLAALQANAQTAQMQSHIGLALDNGVTPAEIIGLITHLAFYTGWPGAMSAVGVARKVFAQRGIEFEDSLMAPRALAATSDVQGSTRSETGVVSVAPALARYTDDVDFADLWRQPDLTLRDRSLITVAALIACGQLDDLPLYLNRAMDNGLSQTQVAEVVTHLAFYAGWPRAMSALPVVRAVFAARH